MSTAHLLPDPPSLGEGIHDGCLLCGRSHPDGFHLEFVLREDGSVRADFACAERFVGYPGQVHGGVVASLLDSAMTNCLYLHGHTAVTAELTVRYHHGLGIKRPAELIGRLDQVAKLLYRTSAELIQDGRRVASAKARFMDYPGPPGGPASPAG